MNKMARNFISKIDRVKKRKCFDFVEEVEIDVAEDEKNEKLFVEEAKKYKVSCYFSLRIMNEILQLK
jgi:hypothetical protein